MQQISRAPLIILLFILVSLPLLGGCSTLIGTVRPVEEKSDQYGVADLSKESPAVWKKLTPSEEGGEVRDHETTATEIPDVAFQSQTTASIISINSSRRPSVETEAKDLKSLTNLLLLGITDSAQRTEKDLTIQNTPALETTTAGKLSGKEIILRTVVLRRKACVYDLLYMSSPANFPTNEPDFSHFVASLRLK